MHTHDNAHGSLSSCHKAQAHGKPKHMRKTMQELIKIKKITK